MIDDHGEERQETPEGERSSDPAGDPPPPSGPRVVLSDADSWQAADRIERLTIAEPPLSPFRSVFFAFGFATVGSILWAVTTIVTDYQLGIAAIVLGILAGVGAAKGGRGVGAQTIGAFAAAWGYFFGVLVTLIGLVATGNLRVPQEEKPAAAESREGQTETPVEEPEAGPDTPNEIGLGEFLIAMAALFGVVVVETFSSVNAIFLAIAVWEGWRIPRAS